jgi:hypothetical protein
MTNLPTTPGTVVSFFSAFEVEEGMSYVATLIPGMRTSTGVMLDSVWGSGSIQGITDMASIFTTAFMEEQEVTVLHAPQRTEDEPKLSEEEFEELNYGSVVVASFAEEPAQLATFTPLYLNQETGEVEEASWVNSYGDELTFATATEVHLLYRT